MAARATWKGQLRLALVSCPIQLIPATTSKDHIHFHKLNRETGNRLRQQMIDAESGAPVSADETVMGYEFAKGQYVTVEKEEIESLKIESSETISIERVLPEEEIDWLYWEKPYLVEPAGKTGLDIFATIREAMSEKGVVGVGRAVISRRERPVLVMPRGKGMMIVTLRDPDEVRKPEEVFDGIKDVKIDKQNLTLAEMLIDKMKGKLDPSLFEDRYDEALHKLVEAKMKGQEPVVAEAPEKPSNVVNLFDALKASLEGGGPSKEERPAKAKAKSGNSSARKAPKAKRRKRA